MKDIIFFIKKIKSDPLEALFTISFILIPLGIFTVRGWTSTLFFITLSFAIALLLKDYFGQEKITAFPIKNNWLIIICIAFSLPISAIFISQSIRNQFYWADYDAPSRFLLSLPILITIIKKRISIIYYLEYIIPLTLIITFARLFFIPHQQEVRLAAAFIGPTTVGQITLSLAILSLLMLLIKRKNDPHKLLLITLKVIGGIIGLYLSIASQTRTGWAAVPIILFLLFIKYNPQRKFLTFFIATLAVIIIPTSSYLCSNIIKERTDIAIHEITSYQWNSMNPDTSVGARISFARMAVYFFKIHPIAGWGDSGFSARVNDPYIIKFASSEATRNRPIHGGFHNDLTTNMVHWGIFGLFAILCVFLIPFLFFYAHLKKSFQIQQIAFLGISFLIFLFISSMTIDILWMKSAATFHIYILISLIGAIFVEESSENKKYIHE